MVNRFTEPSEVPVSTPLSDRVSRDLKKRGFAFVGTTIVYSYLQAVGVGDALHEHGNRGHHPFA